MAKAGRPKSGKPVRDMIVSVRFTPSEYHYLQGLAMRRGLTFGELVRSLALADMARADEKLKAAGG